MIIIHITIHFDPFVGTTKERKPPTVRGSICKDAQQADHNIVDECPAEPISVAVQMTDHLYHIGELPRKLKAQFEQSNAEVVGMKKKTGAE